MIVRAPRRPVMIPARMRAGGGPVDICIRDMSARAMLVEAASPPPAGTYVEIIGADHSITGRVLWVREQRFGVRTRERLNLAVTPAQQRAAQLIAQPAAPLPGDASRGSATAPAAADLQHRADRSRAASRAMEYAAIALCAAVAAAIIAVIAYEVIARPMRAVSASLPPAG